MFFLSADQDAVITPFRMDVGFSGFFHPMAAVHMSMPFLLLQTADHGTVLRTAIPGMGMAFPFRYGTDQNLLSCPSNVLLHSADQKPLITANVS